VKQFLLANLVATIMLLLRRNNFIVPIAYHQRLVQLYFSATG